MTDEKDDALRFVIEAYGTEIEKELDTKDISISFYDSSENYFDSFESVPAKLKAGDFRVTFFNDYSLNSDRVVTDFSIGILKDGDKKYKVLKFVTPFTFRETYDFIIVKRTEASEIFRILNERKHKEHFVFNPKEMPIVGLSKELEDVEQNSISFLLDEKFRNHCEAHHIKTKRGIVLEGLPGTGKSLTLKHIKSIALQNNIEFHSFADVEDFIRNQSDYYNDNKKIFVFEDFDACIIDREMTGKTPNQILGSILNTLDGVNEINNVITIFTTNRIQTFDSALLRPGRIDKVITYQLPSAEVYKEFFEAYIPEEKELFSSMLDKLNRLEKGPSFALLKGICDNINIHKFYKDVTENDVLRIIDETMKYANKNDSVKETSYNIL